MILKAGTYKFNDVLTAQPEDLNEQVIEYTVDGVDFNLFGITDISGTDYEYLSYCYIDISAISITKNIPFYSYETNTWYEGISKIFTTTKDHEVSDDSGNWFTTNTKEVVEPPLATIEYNGQTIAQLNAGETCTIKCAEKRMITDIIIKINS